MALLIGENGWRCTTLAECCSLAAQHGHYTQVSAGADSGNIYAKAVLTWYMYIEVA